MKNLKPIHLGVGVGVILLLVLMVGGKEPVDLRETWSRDHTSAYGAYVLYQLMPGLFPEKEVTTSRRPVIEVLGEGDHAGANYVFITQKADFGPTATRKLQQFAHQGGHVFVSAESFSEAFEEALGFEARPMTGEGEDSLALRMASNRQETYVFPKSDQAPIFSKWDSTRSQILGTTAGDAACFLRIDQGKGAIFIHLFPQAFTNYQLANTPNHPYAAAALTCLPVENAIWDEYYKPYRAADRSLFTAITHSRSLKWAAGVGLLGVVLFILTQMKRTQRRIPERPLLENTSLEFARTMGRLYYLNGNHHDLAQKKILHLGDYIRNRLYLSLHDFSVTEALSVANKIGMAPEKVKQLFHQIRQLQTLDRISEADLVRLSQQIDALYLQSK